MNRLMQLMALNKSSPKAYRIEAKGDTATVYLYDVIGYDWWTGGGVTAKQFAKDLSAIKSGTIHLRINSPGGDVFEARAMVTALKDHPAKVVAHIDGLAASAASFLAMHADEVEITEGAFFMIHNGWTMAVGDRHSMLETASLLEQVDASIANDYAQKTGMEREKIAAMMDAETWINAADAIAMGFADRVMETQKDSKAKASAWNLSAFDNTPSEISNSPEPEQNDFEALRRKLDLLAKCPA